ncbi:DUF930 domain-containing protein [Brucella oryzae]|uniref:DUF930 domain-containing protein n=1 Tax=Brucella oryzae TaxID=335286 RepID=UPI003D15FB5F
MQEASWGLPASVALHLMLALLFLVRLPELPSPAAEHSVNVELVQPPPLEKKPQPKAPEQVAPPPQAFESAAEKQEVKSPPEQAKKKPSETGQIVAAEEKKPLAPQEKPATPAKKLTRAREIYSKDAISDPRVKQALGKLAPNDRIIQVCGIEALEQVRRHQPGAFPDMLAREGGSVSATGLTVSDGAFRSQRRWYAIDFTCKIDAETMVIDSFSYNIGRAIPEGEWARRQLPTD